MLETGRNWELFGYDMRNLGGLFGAAWRDLLWDEESPVRRHLDEPVCLRGEGGTLVYQGGRPSDLAEADCGAVLLPDNLVLSRTVRVPEAVEGNLADALAFETRAFSPFTDADTGYGWRIVGREAGQLRICLAIVSLSAVMTYLGRRYDLHNPREREVWVQVGNDMILIQGFGENHRRQRYRARLLRAAATAGVGALLLLAIVATSALFDHIQLQNVQALAASAEREAEAASDLRTTLSRANAAIEAVNRVADAAPSPHVEIARLTQLLGDEVYLEQFTMSGTELNVRGRATDAAAVMERVSGVQEYEEVTAPRAITRVAGSGEEQFYLTIRLRAGAAQ